MLCPQNWSVTSTEENCQCYETTVMIHIAFHIQAGERIYFGLRVLQQSLVFMK
jgi:hypothetical protein